MAVSRLSSTVMKRGEGRTSPWPTGKARLDSVIACRRSERLLPRSVVVQRSRPVLTGSPLTPVI